jgi:hypothetical protein
MEWPVVAGRSFFPGYLGERELRKRGLVANAMSTPGWTAAIMGSVNPGQCRSRKLSRQLARGQGLRECRRLAGP